MAKAVEKKYHVMLIDISHRGREPMDMGEVEGTFEHICKVADHWCNKHDYDTWKLNIPKKTKTRRKSSKKT